jgi:hypothetical protein
MCLSGILCWELYLTFTYQSQDYQRKSHLRGNFCNFWRVRVILPTILCFLRSILFPQNNCKGKGKGKVRSRTWNEDSEGQYRYSSTLPSTSAVDGVGGQRHTTAALLPENTRYPLYRRLGGSQGRSGQVRKISPPPGFDRRTIQPVASGYTDWAISAHSKQL